MFAAEEFGDGAFFVNRYFGSYYYVAMKTEDNAKILSKAAKEMVGEVARAKRKLLEFEVLMSHMEVNDGKTRRYTSAASL